MNNKLEGMRKAGILAWFGVLSMCAGGVWVVVRACVCLPFPGFFGKKSKLKMKEIYQILKSFFKNVYFSILNTIGKSIKMILNGLNVSL